MFELNEQELEQVAGGRFHYSSESSADGGASARLGYVASASYAHSKVTPCYAESAAANESAALGYHVAATSSAETEAGAGF